MVIGTRTTPSAPAAALRGTSSRGRGVAYRGSIRARGSRGLRGASSAVAPVNGHTVQQLEQMLAAARAAEAATVQATIAQQEAAADQAAIAQQQACRCGEGRK